MYRQCGTVTVDQFVCEYIPEICTEKNEPRNPLLKKTARSFMIIVIKSDYFPNFSH